MLKTITLGSCVSIQGLFVRSLKDDMVEILVGDRTFTGRLVKP